MASPSFQLRLMETFRTVFYTPIYVTVAGGYLESEGLDVDFQTCPPQFPHPLSALNHNAADIVQSGIMRSIIASDWGAETVPATLQKSTAGMDSSFLGHTDRRPSSGTSYRRYHHPCRVFTHALGIIPVRFTEPQDSG